MSFLSKFVRYIALIFCVSLCSVAASETVPDIQTFKEMVVATAKEQGAKSTFTFNDDDPFHLTVSHAGSKADLYLENVYHYFAANPEEDGLDGTIDILTFLIHNFEKQSAVDADDQKEIDHNDIVVVLRHDNYIDQIISYGPKALAQVIYQPVVGDLNEIMMLDSPETMSVLNRGNLTDLSDEAVRRIALDNVRAYLPKLVIDDSSLADINLYYIENNPFLTSSVILIDEFWDIVTAKHPNGVFFALPRKDQLFIIDASKNDAESKLKHLIDVTFEENFHLLSRQVFTYKDGKMALLTP